MGWLLLAIVTLVACCIIYASDQPGQRRRRRDPNYPGPERRDDESRPVDFFQHPAFRSMRCPECDKLKRNACLEEGCEPELSENQRDKQ